MLNVLVNAYAVSPNWGSEQGMGWNWATALARYCHVDVITEGQWKDEIEAAVAMLPQAPNITFHYLPVTDRVRRMCWNQGDWRFYYHYERWQRRALDKAREIMAARRIDVVHQLNMIGFREPGYLWKLPDVPFVWGPVGGMELMPMAYLRGAPARQRLFNMLKNTINRYQYRHSARVRAAVRRADALISAVKGVSDVFRQVYGRDSVLINETGVGASDIAREPRAGGPLRVVWVGKFDFRKQLPLALRAVAATGLKDIELHVCGTASPAVVDEMHRMAECGGVAAQCVWHGNVPHDRILSLMAQSDIMLFTSIMEATSTVVLEAISVGLPVLCFNTCGFGPIVKDFAGITVELSDPDRSVQDFAAALLRVHADRSLLDDISARIAASRGSLTYDAKARAAVELYKQITKTIE